MHFNEIELLGAPRETTVVKPPLIPVEAHYSLAPLWRRSLAALTDLSLFVALALALSPLLPNRIEWQGATEVEWRALFSLIAFVVLVSYYYFTGCWLIWGKTVGGALFDVRHLQSNGAPIGWSRASRRWLGLLVSLLFGGLGFALALFPSRLSLADRLSGTAAVLG